MPRVDLIRDLDRPRGWLLSVDGVAQSYVDLDDPLHLEFEYIRVMAGVLDSALPSGAPVVALHLGGGAATLPRYVAATRPGSDQLVAELDPEVAALAIDRLDLLEVPGLTLVVGDAREVLAAQPDASADAVVSDVFDGSTVPARLLSLQALTDVARVLGPAGVYLANIADARTFDFARPIIATLRAAFDHVALLVEPSVIRGRRFGNLVLVASARPLPLPALRRFGAALIPPVRVVAGDALDGFVGDALPATDERPAVAPAAPHWAHPDRT